MQIILMIMTANTFAKGPTSHVTPKAFTVKFQTLWILTVAKSPPIHSPTFISQKINPNLPNFSYPLRRITQRAINRLKIVRD